MAESNAIIAFEDQPTQQVAAILKNVIADRTEKAYATHNTTLLLWLYDDETLRENILKDWMVEALHQAKQSSRSHMKKACKKALMDMDKTYDKCPIVLEKLTFNVFSHYVSTRRRSKNGKYLSTTSYGGVRSALTHIYRRSGREVGKEFEKKLTEFMSGMKRTVAADKRDKGETLDEGKKPMSYDAYKALCQIFFKGESDEHLFAHVFIILQWNLMARSDNCVKMHMNHIEWRSISQCRKAINVEKGQIGRGMFILIQKIHFSVRSWHWLSTCSQTLISSPTILFCFQVDTNTIGF